MSLLRKNSLLYRKFGRGNELLEHGALAFSRLLPHLKVNQWKIEPWQKHKCSYAGMERRKINVVLSLGAEGETISRSLVTTIQRRRIASGKGAAGSVIETREMDICKLIVERLSMIFTNGGIEDIPMMLSVKDGFDEYIVARHLQAHHDLEVSVATIFRALHTLSEQSYENNAMSFGCLLDSKSEEEDVNVLFPDDFFLTKKFRALSDGYRTAYRISKKGQLLNFVDLKSETKSGFSGKHFYPEWVVGLAQESQFGTCGIALSRQGDILVFDGGTLRFTYRFGKWQYWNHVHFVDLLKDQTQTRTSNLANAYVVKAIYRAALDVSFRRCGGMFVMLNPKENLRNLIRQGDGIGDKRRSVEDSEFDKIFDNKSIQALSRAVVVELASLDGSVVMSDKGKLLAYGAVLRPRHSKDVQRAEGSRTKAAIGASKFGLTIKISSDGQITVYHNGTIFLQI